MFFTTKKQRIRNRFDVLLREYNCTPPNSRSPVEDGRRVGMLVAAVLKVLLEREFGDIVEMPAARRVAATGLGIVICDAWSQLLEREQELAISIFSTNFSAACSPPDSAPEAIATLGVLVERRAVSYARSFLQERPDVCRLFGLISRKLILDDSRRQQTASLLQQMIRDLLHDVH